MSKSFAHTFFFEKVLFLVPFLLAFSGCDTFFGDHVWLNAPVETDYAHDGLILVRASKVKNSSGTI